MARITIGIPVYNGEAYLRHAVDSILGQTFADLELIISDNASTDGTEEICRQYAAQDSRVRYLRQPRNLGASVNHNVLLGAANSEFFKWAAHDDYIAPTFLETCIAALDGDAGAVLAMPGTALVDEDDQPLPFSSERGALVDRGGVCWPTMPEKNSALSAPEATARFEALVLRTVLCTEIFGVMRRSAMLRTRRRGQGSFLGGDKTFLAELCLQGHFWKSDELLFFRRCHSKQYSVVGKSDAYRAEWFFGRRSHAALLHSKPVQKLIFFDEYRRAIARSNLPLAQKQACYRTVLRRTFMRVASWVTPNSEIFSFSRVAVHVPAKQP